MRLNKKIIADLANFIQMRYNISIADYQEQYPDLYKSFLRMHYWMDEAILDTYFNGENKEGWTQQDRWETRKTGKQLLDKISDLQDLSPEVPLKIIDIGCGNNNWKEHLGAKLTGIDPYNAKADFKIGINEYYETQKANDLLEKYDVALVLGSINFGDIAEIEKQIWEAVQLVKLGGKIYWRCNPGISHANPKAQWIDFFPWSAEFIKEIAHRTNCTVDEISWDHDEPHHKRLYSEWTRNKTLASAKEIKTTV
jgi:hypothetical protein